MALKKTIPILRTSVQARSIFAKSADVGNRMVGKFRAGAVDRCRRRTLKWPRLARRPAAAVLQYAPDDIGILDRRDHPHGPLSDRANQRIDLIDLVDQPRPGGAGASFLRPCTSSFVTRTALCTEKPLWRQASLLARRGAPIKPSARRRSSTRARSPASSSFAGIAGNRTKLPSTPCPAALPAAAFSSR